MNRHDSKRNPQTLPLDLGTIPVAKTVSAI
jgi:hypothetical protein